MNFLLARSVITGIAGALLVLCDLIFRRKNSIPDQESKLSYRIICGFIIFFSLLFLFGGMATVERIP